jgi:hypothetical protein
VQAENDKQVTANRKQRADSREQKTGKENSKQRTGNRKQGDGQDDRKPADRPGAYFGGS